MTTSIIPYTGPAAVLYDGKATPISQAHVRDSDLWLLLDELAAATRWEIKAEGVCRDEVCIPIPAGEGAALVWEGGGETWFNLTGFARHLQQPVAHDIEHQVWSFGPPSYEWQSRAASALAPDFTLVDFQGRPHSLSDYRGKKVFLVTWASW